MQDSANFKLTIEQRLIPRENVIKSKKLFEFEKRILIWILHFFLFNIIKKDMLNFLRKFKCKEFIVVMNQIVKKQ